MPQFFLALIVTGLALLLGVAHTKTIYTCKDFDCPRNPNNTAEASCTVNGEDYSLIGNTKIATTNKALDGISFTKGVKFQETRSGYIYSEHTVYLGSPPGFNLTGTQACALAFGSLQLLHFTDKAKKDVDGTCQQAMGGEPCVSALIQNALAFKPSELQKSNKTQSVCSEFMKYIRVPKVCTDSTAAWSGGGSRTVNSLFNATDPDHNPITKNETSNCWPVSPEQNDLTLVGSYGWQYPNTSGNNDKYGGHITPILTLFFPEYDADGNANSKSAFTTPEAQLTCVKPINETTWHEVSSAGHVGKGAIFPAVVAFFCTAVAVLLVV